jgi:hypothetical protein
VGAGLVGNGVGSHAAPDQLGQDFGGIAEQGDGFGFAGLGAALMRISLDAGECLVEVVGLRV